MTTPVVGYRDNAPLVSQAAFQTIVAERDRLLAALNAKGRCMDLLRLESLFPGNTPERVLVCTLTFEHDGSHTDASGCSWTRTDTGVKESAIAGHLRDGLIYRGARFGDDENPVLVAFQVIDELKELASAWEQTARKLAGDRAVDVATKTITVPVEVNEGGLVTATVVHRSGNGVEHVHGHLDDAYACQRANGGEVYAP